MFFSCGCTKTLSEEVMIEVKKNASADWDEHFEPLGLSNTLGPGTLYLDNKNNIWKAFPNPENPKLVITGKEVSGGKFQRKTVDFMLDAKYTNTLATAYPNIDLAAKINKSESKSISIKSWRIDRLAQGDYLKWISSQRSGDFGKSTTSPDDRAKLKYMTSAIAVTGFTATFTFDESTATELKSKIADNRLITLDGGLKGSFSSDFSQFVLSLSEKTVYCYGRFESIPPKSKSLEGTNALVYYKDLNDANAANEISSSLTRAGANVSIIEGLPQSHDGKSYLVNNNTIYYLDEQDGLQRAIKVRTILDMHNFMNISIIPNSLKGVQANIIVVAK